MLWTRDPTGFWVPDCFLGLPLSLLAAMFEFSTRARAGQFSLRLFLENIQSQGLELCYREI